MLDLEPLHPRREPAMRLPIVTRRRHERALAERSHVQVDSINAAARRAQEQRAAHVADVQRIIDGIAHEYYLASAIHEASPVANHHQSGVMDGLRRAMAAVTGRDIISTGFGMEHGIPQGPQGHGWVAVIDVIDGCDVPVVLHDDVREPVAERLAALRMAALRKDNHPLAEILTRA